MHDLVVLRMHLVHRHLPAFGGAISSMVRAAAPQRRIGSKKYGADDMPDGWVRRPAAFVSIDEDGTVTIVCHRSELARESGPACP